jgi:hypothetical protein
MRGRSASAKPRSWQRSPTSSGAQTLVLVAHDFTATTVDNDRAGTSPGDEISVQGQLSSRRDAESAGRLEAHEVLTSLNQNGGGTLQLLFTAVLARARSRASPCSDSHSRAHPTARPPSSAGQATTENVRGDVLIHPNGQTTRLTFLLLA